MSQSRETIRDITVAAGTRERVWDAPSSLPFRDIHIWITSRGADALAGACSWEVFYGGGWTGGKPFDVDNSAHVGGLTQANGALVLGAEVLDHVHEDPDYFPSNQPVVEPPPRTAVRPGGFPIVLELNNTGGSDLNLTVCFVSQVESNLY